MLSRSLWPVLLRAQHGLVKAVWHCALVCKALVGNCRSLKALLQCPAWGVADVACQWLPKHSTLNAACSPPAVKIACLVTPTVRWQQCRLGLAPEEEGGLWCVDQSVAKA